MLDHPQPAVLRLEVPAAELIAPALARLQRQAQYARLLAGGGNAAAEARRWLDRAAACLAALARPLAVLAPVGARALPGGIELAGRVVLDGDDLAREVAQGAGVSAYLLTLGFDQGRAFNWLEGDYAAHHVQSDLSNEVLFALGRQVHRIERARSPGARLRRVPVTASAVCGQRRVWDPARVQALMGVFDGTDTGVTVSDSGCFQPLNSLLGLTIARV